MQKSKQMSILKGDPAHLQCNVLGDNPIDIIWKGSKNQVISDDIDLRLVHPFFVSTNFLVFYAIKFNCCLYYFRYSIREQMLDEGKISELSIAKVFRHDTGIFTCYAKNNYGQDHLIIELIVQGTNIFILILYIVL